MLTHGNELGLLTANACADKTSAVSGGLALAFFGGALIYLFLLVLFELLSLKKLSVSLGYIFIVCINPCCDKRKSYNGKTNNRD